jgi:flagellin-like hook-associated protein FlgL
MSDISLNAGIRSNLLQLQQSSRLFDRTTERLASGKEVNSAIDNPTNFFASVNLNDRASGLETRLDSMGQAIQRIKAADNGISTIRGFVSAMKGVVNNALGNTDADARADLGTQFNELIVQISETAKDSGYAGINLLERNETETVQFNETFDASVLNVRGFDVRGPGSDGRGRVDASGNVASAAITANITQASVASVSSVASASAQASVASVSASGFSATVAAATNNTVSFAGGTGFTATGTGASTVAIGTASSASQASQASVASVASQAATATSAVAIALDTQRDDAVGIQGAGSGAGMVDWGGANYQDDLAAVIQQLETFDEALQTQASDLAQNLATITTREDFSNELINTLTEGSDKLTLADLNEEGANLLALQTSQQLATQSLSLASQQSQQVLQLLG